MSDSTLAEARRVTAKAAAPEGGGKDPNLVLHILDGVSGTLDPAFDTHALPLVRYATAWWEKWQDRELLAAAFHKSVAKLASAKRSHWDVVTGPIGAMVASLWRLKWSLCHPHLFVDDTGGVFDLYCDPPCVLARACKASVRRWRLAQVIHKFPVLAPNGFDYAAPNMSPQFMYSDGLLPQGTIDLVGQTQKLLDKRGHKSGQFDMWLPSFKGSLISAITGGQWTQSRLASTRAWTSDSACQLCKSEVGTIQHRRSCSATMPVGGWPMPSKEASQFRFVKLAGRVAGPCSSRR